MERIFKYAIKDTAKPAGIYDVDERDFFVKQRFTEYPWMRDEFWIKQLINVSRNDIVNLITGFSVFNFLEGGFVKDYVEKEITKARIAERNQPHTLGTVKEIAEKLGVSLKQVRTWKKEGILDQKIEEFYNPSTPS